MSNQALESLSPTETLDLESGLSLAPRIKLRLIIHRSDKSVAPVDEWKLKRSLIEYLKSKHSITIPDEDENDVVQIKCFKDLKKRKRDDPVAFGSLCVRNLGFLSRILVLDGDDVKAVEKRFVEWRRGIVEEMDGMGMNLEGNKFQLSVSVPESDDFEGMKKEWEERAAFGVRGYPRDIKQQPDTIVLRGVPSRWFAETRVSSKPSMLVTHTIFSAFGEIRNLDVAEDDDTSKDADADEGNLVSGLHCKIVVRFEKHKDFYNALKVLSGRSLHKQGSRMKADYEVTWDKDGFFRNARSNTQEKSRWLPAIGGRNQGNDAIRRHSHVSRLSPDDSRPKRFKAHLRECLLQDSQTTSSASSSSSVCSFTPSQLTKKDQVSKGKQKAFSPSPPPSQMDNNFRAIVDHMNSVFQGHPKYDSGATPLTYTRETFQSVVNHCNAIAVQYGFQPFNLEEVPSTDTYSTGDDLDDSDDDQSS